MWQTINQPQANCLNKNVSFISLLLVCIVRFQCILCIVVSLECGTSAPKIYISDHSFLAHDRVLLVFPLNQKIILNILRIRVCGLTLLTNLKKFTNLKTFLIIFKLFFHQTIKAPLASCLMCLYVHSQPHIVNV